MGILKSETIKIGEAVIYNALWESSNILKTSYNATNKQLFVTFKRGGVYYYNGVDISVHKNLLECDSIGIFINQEIKANYTAVKVGVADEEDVSGILTEIQTLITENKNKL